MSSRVEQGLRAFCQAWNEGRVSPAFRLAGMLRHQTINCQVQEGGEYVVRADAEHLSFEPGSDPTAHATLTMAEGDWLGVLDGRWSVWSVQLAGRCYAPQHEGALVRNFGLMLQSYALRRPTASEVS